MARTTARRIAALTLLAATALAACSTGAGGGGEPEGEAPGGGALVVGVTSDPDTLFPWKATQFQAIHVVQNLYSTLTELDQNLEVVPGLAEDWKVAGDGKSITFALRSGMTFADGSELDSADVKSSLERIQDEKTAAVAASTLASVTGIEAPDPQSVKLELSAPDAGLLSGLASINLAIISSEDTEQSLTTKANGSGPFTLGERVPNESLTLQSNPDYWGTVPAVGSVEFRIIPDETSIVSALQSGNVQLATFDDPLVAKTAESGDVSLIKTPQLSYHALQLNARRKPLDDENVRLAIQCAIDRKAVLDTAAMGEGEVVGPITSPAYKSDPNARPCPERDLAKAKDYLARSGHAGGLTIKTIVSQGEYATSVAEAQAVAAQLAEAGITLTIEPMEIGTFVDRWVAADFDTAIALNGGRPDPDGMYGRYFTSTGNLNKVAGYSSPELDALFTQGRQSQDEAQRKQLYADVSKHLEDHAVWIWLFTSYSYTATTSNVSGYTPMANGSMQSLRSVTVN
jgi:peptide/nickel transport system substrate-binding protein